MANFKVIISDPSNGKSQVVEAKDQQAQMFLGAKLGDVIDVSVLGVKGKIKLTGGSDRAGFPMRADVMGGGKRYVLLTQGVGLRKVGRGEQRRKLVRGNTVTEEIFQLNAVLVR